MKPEELLEYAAKDPATWSKDEVRRLLREAATAITKQQQDAERYRWLRMCDANQEDAVMIRGDCYDRDELLSGAELDAAIDAAMAGANARIEQGRSE